MEFTIEQAQAQLSGLIEQALSGEEVVITIGDPSMRVAPLLPFSWEKADPQRLAERSDPDVGPVDPFFDPLPEDELRLWNGEVE